MNSLAITKMRSGRGVAVIAASVLALFLASCGGGGSGGGGATSGEGDGSKPGELTTLTFLSWHGEDLMRPVIDAFEAENADVKVEMSYSPPVAEYTQTLQTRISGNQAPDVFRTGFESLGAILESGSAMDLTGKPFMEGLGQANIDAYSRDGKAYGMSVASWAGALAYNPALLAEVGADGVPDSWAGFLDLSLQLKDQGVTPYLEPVDDVPKLFQAFLGAEYADPGANLGEAAVFDGQSTFEQEWSSAAASWFEMFERDILGIDVVSLTGDQIRDEFIAGRLAMMHIGPWDLPALEESEMDYQVSLIPMPEGAEQYASGAPDVAWVIYSGLEGAKLDAAERFLGFINSEKGLELMAASTGEISTSSNYTASVTPSYQETYEEILLKDRYYLCMAHWPKFVDSLQVEATSLFQQAVQGSISTEQIGAGMDAKLSVLE